MARELEVTGAERGGPPRRRWRRLGPLPAAPRSSAARVRRHLRVPTSHPLVQRVAVGLAGALTSPGARVPVGVEVRRAVPGYVCSPVRAGRRSGQA